MSLLGVTVTAAGAERLAAGHPQLALGDLAGAAADVEPGRPLRLRSARGDTLGLADGRSAYRLVNGEGDSLSGLAADVYGPYVVVTALARGLLGHARLLA